MKTKRLLVSLTLGLGMTLAFLWLLTAGSMTLVHADTYTVTNTDASGPGSLRQAILDANGNAGHDTIDFGITGTIVLTDTLPAIGDDLTITGPGAEQLAVSGANAYRVFSITSGIAVTITGVTVRDGYAADSNGGGIWSAGTLYLDSVEIISNTASGSWPLGRGGGLFVYDGRVTLSATQIVSNSAYTGGGVFVFSSSAILDMNGGRVDSNLASGCGGVSVYNGSVTLSGTQVASNDSGGMCVYYGSATLSETQVVSNSAEFGAGVHVEWDSATLNVSGGQIGYNSAQWEGGGVLVVEGSATLSGTQVVGNSAGYGGGMYVQEGSVTLNGAQVVSNSAKRHGGGVYVEYGSATLSRTQLLNNSADDPYLDTGGGGIYVWYGSVIMSETEVVGNSAPFSSGGGIFVGPGSSYATLKVSGGVIGSNSAKWRGGGVVVWGGDSLTLSGTQVFSNSASYGGGVYVDGTALMSGVQVFSNSASYGGGVYVDWGSATLNKTQVVNNSATDEGGGVYIERDDATLNVSGGEIGSNSATVGGGVHIEYGSATLSGTGVVSNSAQSGGGVFVDSGSATLSETQVLSNSAQFGGGVYVFEDSGTLNVSRGRIGGNSATSEGGGVYVEYGSATLSETQVVSNSSDFKGGGVYVHDGSATLSGTQVINNSAAYNGGGVHVESGNVTLSEVQVIGNSAYGFDTDRGGGGVCVYWGSATLSGTQVLSNSASYNGGGIFVGWGSAALNGGVIASNSARQGGGISVLGGSATLSGTQVVGNSASYYGGGVLGGRSVTLSGAQVISNSASYGGGIHVSSGSVPLNLNVSGGRIDGNSASDEGGGVYVEYGSAMLSGTQIVNNSASDGGGVYLSSSGAVTATDGCIVLNSDTAVNRVDGTLIATDNWWGAADGPGGAGPGSGDTVSAGVDYANFKTVAPAGCPSRPIPAPEVTVHPLSVAFGNQDVDAGPTVSQTVTITNDGTADLHISAITPTGDTGEFNLADSGEITLTSGSTRAVDVSFDPSSLGTKAVTLTVQSDDGDEPTVEVALTGTGTDQEITVAPSSLAFGGQDVDAGPTVLQTVTITNDGSADLHISSVSLTGTNADEFAVEGDTGESTLTPGDTRAVQVSFDPATTGTKSASLTVQSDDGDEASVDVALSGVGIAADLVVAKSVTPTVVVLGDTVTYTIVISNAGDATATDVLMTDPLPSAVSFGSQSAGTALIPLPDHVYRWGPYDVAAFAAYTITFTANVTDNADFAGQMVTNTAYVTATNVATDSDDAVFAIMGIAQAGYGSDPAPGSLINVGTTSVGSTVSATLTISETGEATLMVTPTLSGPDAADFGFTPITLTILDGGAAQDLTISCTPSFTGTLARTLAATLTVVHNAPGSPAVYSLRCTGEAMAYVYLPLVLKGR